MSITSQRNGALAGGSPNYTLPTRTISTLWHIRLQVKTMYINQGNAQIQHKSSKEENKQDYNSESSATSKAQQNVSLSSNARPRPSAAHRTSRNSNFSVKHIHILSPFQNFKDSLAGIPIHSAISSSFSFSPDSHSSEDHSLLHVYNPPPPQHSASDPPRFGLGFHRAWTMFCDCRRTLRSRGLKGSEGDGKL